MNSSSFPRFVYTKGEKDEEGVEIYVDDAQEIEPRDCANQNNILSVRERVLLELILKANSLKAMRLFGRPESRMLEKGGEEDDQMRIIH